MIRFVFQILKESLLYTPFFTNNSLKEEGSGFSPFNNPWFSSSAETEIPILFNSIK